VGQLSYLVLKCFTTVFSGNRVLTGVEKENNDFGKFIDWTKRTKSVQSVKSGFTSIVKKFDAKGKLFSNNGKLDDELVSWPLICIEICDILSSTLPILEAKLTENNGNSHTLSLSLYIYILIHV
jgi:hypothetical protein